jgi:hydroxybutyrate-dimer hydrolase
LDEELKPGPLSPERLAVLFAKSSGHAPSPPALLTSAQIEFLSRIHSKLNRATIPPVGQIEILFNDTPLGPMMSRYAPSFSGVMDLNLEGALRLRRLAVGIDEKGCPLMGEELEKHRRIREGISEIRAGGNLRGIPTIILHGRNDAILPPNHTSRAYFGVNRIIEGEDSGLRYYEITHAHHMDAFNILPGFNTRFVPIHHYLIRALNLMLAHLKFRKALPPSQVVRPRPRSMMPDGQVEPITKDHVPPISPDPRPEDRICFENFTVDIPE